MQYRYLLTPSETVTGMLIIHPCSLYKSRGPHLWADPYILSHLQHILLDLDPTLASFLGLSIQHLIRSFWIFFSRYNLRKIAKSIINILTYFLCLFLWVIVVKGRISLGDTRIPYCSHTYKNYILVLGHIAFSKTEPAIPCLKDKRHGRKQQWGVAPVLSYFCKGMISRES
jgi:hypothetical protein